MRHAPAFLHRVLGLFALWTVGLGAPAQADATFPSRAITIVVPFSAGNGTSTHLVGALFMHETKTRLMHIPYKGNAPALNDTIAGHVDVMFDQATNSTGQIQGGRLRALAVTSDKRVPDLPDVPTVAELGFPELEVTSWTVLAAPAGTPPGMVSALSEALRETLADADIQAKIAQTGGMVNFEDAARAATFVEGETARGAR